MLIKENAA
ncbi:uncharacterized protein FFC1_01686 [Fusarium fujikuroi]|nr:uncharacterized protein FFC1_01686 [Fusarium fujikuroi]